MVNDIARQAAIDNAVSKIDPGFAMDEGDAQTVTSNTDEKATVYSMIDGSPRPILKIDLRKVLGKKLENGAPAFWMEGMPGEAPPYIKGNVKCMLHPDFNETDGPSGMDRAFVDAAGLANRTCNMSNRSKPNRADFASVWDRDAHMKRAHRMELATITDALENARRLEAIERDRRAAEQQRLATEAMIALASNARGVAAAESFDCILCDFTSKTPHGLSVHTGREHKPEA